MLSERIRAMIRDYNSWWECIDINVPVYQRHVLSRVRTFMESKQIIALTGLRRVGKTTIMKQLITELKVQKNNIFYFLFDDLIAQNSDVLIELLDYYLKTIAKDGKKYIFLDEVQKIPYWQDIIKRYYDTRDDVKFVVSGSASLNIKKSKESLAGRLFDIYITPLSFREFLELNDVNIGKISIEKLSEHFEQNIHKKAIMNEMLRKYILRGAFPEIAKEEKLEFVHQYIRSSVIEKMIYEDISLVFKIKRRDVLMALFEYCSKETSNLLDLTNLGKLFSVNYLTIRSYLFYLKSSFVIDIAPNYSGSILKQLRKNKKIHIVHPSISLALMKYKEAVLDVDEITGRFIETIVFQHARCMGERIFFWRTPQKEEVDILVEINNEFIPIEVKFRNNISNSDTKILLKFMERKNIRHGFLITKDLFAEKELSGRHITFVPAWLFLLVV
ncbi:MAG: ATP-binding protein [Candidatus Micrarchaeota archaeon]